MPDWLSVLTSRGMVHDVTPDLATRLARRTPITAYAGFDPTADSLHVGNLLPVMALAWLQRTGGRPIVVLGGATGLIGDPSGKRTERPMMDATVVARNIAAIRSQLAAFLEFGDRPDGALLLDNTEWLGPITVLDFLRDTGKHFTANYMLQKESVSARMETGISYTEFSYMLLQAHDFAHLARTRQCEVQLGGSDQWGNITAGIELAARRDQAKLHGVSLPLLTTASGAKFGKTESGAIWLDKRKTSPYQFHQFWLQVDDAEVERLLRLMTFVPLDEIAGVMRQHATDPGKRSAQRLLADSVTETVHGAASVRRATDAARILFGSDDVERADAATLAMVIGQIPSTEVTLAELDGGIPIAEALLGAGLATSKADARRGLASGGFSVNGGSVGETHVLSRRDLLEGGVVLLRKGKRSWAGLRVEAAGERSSDSAVSRFPADTLPRSD